MEAELVPRRRIEIINIPLAIEFEEWLKRKSDKNKYKSLSETLKHFRDNELILNLKIDHKNVSYSVIIGHDDDGDRDDGISFEFYRLKEGQWRFGIDIEDVEIKDSLELRGLGYARFLMAAMVYCLEKHIDLLSTQDLEMAGDDLTSGICADSSKGFWKYMGMEEGKYSMDKDRYNSMTGPNCGYDKEFLMRDWLRWIFSDSKKRARDRFTAEPGKSKKKKKYKNTKKRSKKVKRKKTKSKRNENLNQRVKSFKKL